eukprot:COSAG05_NODE_5994_length_1043_cov_1.368644_2_plen_173_part_01
MTVRAAVMDQECGLDVITLPSPHSLSWTPLVYLWGIQVGYILNCTRTPRRYDLLVRRGNDPEARKVAMVRRFHCPAACSFPAGVVACLASFRSVCLLPSMSTASFAVPWSLVASAQWLSSGFLMVFSNPKTLKSIVFCANSPYLAWMPPAYTAVYRATEPGALHLHPWRRAIQ